MQTCLPTIEHRYGKNIHILNHPVLNTWLARLCHPDTFQPMINLLVKDLYQQLIQFVLQEEFETERIQCPTRMTALHPEAKLSTETLKASQKAITVNLARAGTFPSQICFDLLNTTLDPRGVRQDHILASRLTNTKEQVTGAHLGATKIGGSIENAIVMFPDPMGATGSTIIEAMQFYKEHVTGQPHKFIALHLIITPEYIQKIQAHRPDLIVYALRLDRGLSPKNILESVPGTHPEQEKGLNEKQYIVPGGGGLGELMNNSFV